MDTQRILDTYRRLRSPLKVAKALKLSLAEVESALGPVEHRRSLFQRPERFGGLGRATMQKHIVARKRVMEAWDNTQPEIADARRQFELGLVTLATGRDGDWSILYAIPLRDGKARPNYFQSGVIPTW